MASGEALARLATDDFDAGRERPVCTGARRAVLAADREGPTLAAVTLDVEVEGYAARRSGVRRVGIRVDGRDAGTWDLPDGEMTARRIEVPALGLPGRLRLEFALKDPAVPAQHDGSTASRRLGFAIRSLTVTPR